MHPELPRALDINGVEFTTGAFVRDIVTGTTFLVRGMYRQDEGPSNVALCNKVEVVSQRPLLMEDLVQRINETRASSRSNPDEGVRTDPNSGSQVTGRTIVWGWGRA